MLLYNKMMAKSIILYKVVMPTIDDEKQAVYVYLEEHAVIFNHQQHLIVEHADNNILQKFLASYNLNTFTSVDFPNGKLTLG